MRHVGALGRVLCREHRRGQRVSGDLPLEQFLVLSARQCAVLAGPCQVTACPPNQTSQTRYCEAHQFQMRTAYQQDFLPIRVAT
jgi:hypothetical protein